MTVRIMYAGATGVGTGVAALTVNGTTPSTSRSKTKIRKQDLIGHPSEQWRDGRRSSECTPSSQVDGFGGRLMQLVSTGLSFNGGSLSLHVNLR